MVFGTARYYRDVLLFFFCCWCLSLHSSFSPPSQAFFWSKLGPTCSLSFPCFKYKAVFIRKPIFSYGDYLLPTSFYDPRSVRLSIDLASFASFPYPGMTTPKFLVHAFDLFLILRLRRSRRKRCARPPPFV